MEKNNKKTTLSKNTNKLNRIKNFYQKLDSVEKIESYFWQKSLRLLQKKEYSKQELSQKLLQTATRNLPNFDSIEIQKIVEIIIKKLQNYNYINDERFAKINLQTKSYKYGNQRLIFDLQQKGISQEIINQNIEKFKENEFQRCLNLYIKKFKKTAEVNAENSEKYNKEKAKQIRFLASRGFSLNTIYKVIDYKNYE